MVGYATVANPRVGVLVDLIARGIRRWTGSADNGARESGGWIWVANHRGYGHQSATPVSDMIYLCCGGITVQ
jgi:hypothetical protein